jgi:MFS family permease
MRHISRTQYALWAVYLATAAVRIGFGAIMPVMPIYARAHGLTTAMIAVMTNAYMLSNVLFQSYAGHLGDRWGRRPVMLVGTWLYTAAAALFMIDAGPWYYVALRAVEGLGASAFGPAARAYVADLVPEEDRGRAYGQLTSFDMAGILFGPMIGGMVQNLAGPRAPFAICAVLGLLAGLPLLFLTRQARLQPAPELAAQAEPAQAPDGAGGDSWLRRAGLGMLTSPAFWAVALPGMGFAYLNAMYSVTWSLYMERIGATTWQISLSFTLFAIPMVLLMVPFGRLADRIGRPLMIAVGGLGSAIATVTYGLLPYPWALIGFGVLDGAASAMFTPANQAFMADVAPRRMRGKFMGLVGSVQTAATIAFVMLVGYLYDHSSPLMLFGLGALALLFSTATAVLIMVRRPAADLRASLERTETA